MLQVLPGGNLHRGQEEVLGQSVLARLCDPQSYSKSPHLTVSLSTPSQAAQYIGELARYLYATPVSEYETKHCLRMMFGNGMRMELWQRFVDRFKVPKICEYYGSTEGNCSISNLTGKK